jgi:superfamily II DNA or RNA helicase
MVRLGSTAGSCGLAEPVYPMASDIPTARRMPERGDKLAINGRTVTVQLAAANGENGVQLAVALPDGTTELLTLEWDRLQAMTVPANDGGGDSVRAITALWAKWMQYTIPRIRSAVLATTPLSPYAHQDEAVSAHMVVQPRMRMLLGDEPGTGKTIMTGMYLAEARRRGLIPGLAVIVVPAHLVRKWQRDLRRYFAVDVGVVTREIGLDPHDLRPDVETWVVSLDLFTYNPDVRRKLAGEHASWSLVVFDEAHRLTPTSQYLGAAGELAEKAFHLLLLTATPHRGKESFFRALFNLLDPNLYPWDPSRQDYARPLRPSPLHYLRRMKETLRDHDGSDLFPERTAEVRSVSLTGLEQGAYDAVMDYVDAWYPDRSTLARSIYGKRAASSLKAAHDTLERRADALIARREDPTGAGLPRGFDRDDLDGANVDDDGAWEDAENVVVHAASRDRRAEIAAVEGVLTRLRAILAVYAPEPSRWVACKSILAEHNIAPSRGQLLVFTEFTDTAKWVAALFAAEGFSVEVLEGKRSPDERDDLQRGFLSGAFQVLVSTDAGGEGIDLQSAHVMVDWDIPWSLVRLEQRMGRLHRIGQRHAVSIYHLVAPETREGRVQTVMLENFAAAARALHGRIFDLMDATAVGLKFDYPAMLAAAQQGRSAAARLAASVPTVEQLRAAAEQITEQHARIASPPPDLADAEERLRSDRLEAINPVMVEAFIRQVARSNGWRVRTGSAPGLLRLTADVALPGELGGGRSREVCADEGARRRAWEAGIITAREVLVLGPAEEAFTLLVNAASVDTEGDLRRGSAAVDEAALTDYLLVAYESHLTMHDGPRRRTRAVPLLIRYSGSEAFPVAWESVMALLPAIQPPQRPEPAAREACVRAAQRASADECALRQRETDAWITKATEDLQQVADEHRRQLRDYPEDVAEVLRRRFQAERGTRRAQLDAMAQVHVTEPAPLGWIYVHARGATEDRTTDPDSETRAILVVAAELDAHGFEVDDRQTAGVGYDLYATHRRTDERRLVEVKGQKGHLGPVTLERTEWEQAQQRGRDYWLYVVTDCATAPRVTVRAQDPAARFAGPRTIQRFEIPLRLLRTAAEP